MLALMPAVMVSADDRPSRYENLPAKAKTFIEQNFPEAKVALVTVEDEAWDAQYDVIFTDGNKLEFDKAGEWKEVDCKYTRVPENVLPKRIREHVKANHPDSYVIKIERGWRKYEVKLDNRMELEFDKNGKFMRFDD